jgi:hypothetical protein
MRAISRGHLFSSSYTDLQLQDEEISSIVTNVGNKPLNGKHTHVTSSPTSVLICKNFEENSYGRGI